MLAEKEQEIARLKIELQQIQRDSTAQDGPVDAGDPVGLNRMLEPEVCLLIRTAVCLVIQDKACVFCTDVFVLNMHATCTSYVHGNARLPLVVLSGANQ